MPTDTVLDIPPDLPMGLDGELLTPKKVIELKKEDFQSYKDNLYKFLDLGWTFILSSAGVFGVVSTTTKILDTSDMIRKFLFFYICLGSFSVLVGKLLDRVYHLRFVKFCVAACLWAILGFVFTGVLHLKYTGWEFLIFFVTFFLAICAGFYMWKVEKWYYLEFLERRAENQFYEMLRKRYANQQTIESPKGVYEKLMKLFTNKDTKESLKGEEWRDRPIPSIPSIPVSGMTVEDLCGMTVDDPFGVTDVLDSLELGEDREDSVKLSRKKKA